MDRCKSPEYAMNQSLDSIDLGGKYGPDSSDRSHFFKRSPNKLGKNKPSKSKHDSSEAANRNTESVLVICDNAPSIPQKFELNNGDINKNVSILSTCPKDGVCQMHMRDAAKCHLS